MLFMRRRLAGGRRLSSSILNGVAPLKLKTFFLIVYNRNFKVEISYQDFSFPLYNSNTRKSLYYCPPTWEPMSGAWCWSHCGHCPPTWGPVSGAWWWSHCGHCPPTWRPMSGAWCWSHYGHCPPTWGRMSGAWCWSHCGHCPPTWGPMSEAWCWSHCGHCPPTWGSMSGAWCWSHCGHCPPTWGPMSGAWCWSHCRHCPPTWGPMSEASCWSHCWHCPPTWGPMSGAWCWSHCGQSGTAHLPGGQWVGHDAGVTAALPTYLGASEWGMMLESLRALAWIELMPLEIPEECNVEGVTGVTSRPRKGVEVACVGKVCMNAGVWTWGWHRTYCRYSNTGYSTTS